MPAMSMEKSCINDEVSKSGKDLTTKIMPRKQRKEVVDSPYGADKKTPPGATMWRAAHINASLLPGGSSISGAGEAFWVGGKGGGSRRGECSLTGPLTLGSPSLAGREREEMVGVPEGPVKISFVIL